MKVHVAITRAQPEADATAARLRALGAEPIVAPLLEIQPRDFDQDVTGAQALVFTSTNGVRAFTRALEFSALPVLAVGDATAQAARDAGFRTVRSADGDAATLIELARDALDPKAGRIVHIAGVHVTGDITGALKASGFDAERRVAFEARAVSALPAAYRARLDVVLFHSARAADVFVTLGAPNAGDMIAVCISDAVAAAASISAWKQVVVAPRPREDALLAAALASTDANA